MTNRVAILSRLPPLAIFAKVFGIEYLSKSGFEVVFVDVSFLIDGVRGQDLYQEQLSIPGCETVVINRLEELEAFVKESFESTIFIDQVSGLAEFNPNTGQVFKVLKRYNAKYYVMSNEAIPGGSHDVHSFTFALFLKIKKALKNPRLLYEFLTKKLIVQFIKMNILYQKPYRIFGLEDSPIVTAYLEKYGMRTSVITPTNSNDYDIYLEYMRETAQPVMSTETCVFLDEDHTNHPDFFLFGLAPLSEFEYISSMNHFFDCVESKTGLSVVIAAHPKSRFSSENHQYGKRAFIKGNTVGIVAKSKMVIAHSSTSINFPVLFGKPIVLVLTSQMKDRPEMVNIVKVFSGELGLDPVDVDSADEVDAFNIDLDGQRDYEVYLHKYVKNKAPINKLAWEIVAEVALKDLAQLELTKKYLTY